MTVTSAALPFTKTVSEACTFFTRVMEESKQLDLQGRFEVIVGLIAVSRALDAQLTDGAARSLLARPNGEQELVDLQRFLAGIVTKMRGRFGAS